MYMYIHVYMEPFMWRRISYRACRIDYIVHNHSANNDEEPGLVDGLAQHASGLRRVASRCLEVLDG